MLVDGPIGLNAIGEEAGSFGGLGLPMTYWVMINGAVETKIQLDQIQIEHTAEGTARASLIAINPINDIDVGMTCYIVDEGFDIFAGIIRTVIRDMDQAESYVYYRIEVNGWDLLLDRHLVTSLYTNLSTKDALRQMVADTKLNLDAVQLGVVENGVIIFLADAKHVRASDYLRDIGSAGGGVAYIDDHKFIQFRPTTPLRSPIIVNEALVESASRMSDLDNYRNRQFVKVTGLDGATTVTEQRDDVSEQTARQLLEGGSGIYEAFEDIRHPTSSTVGELSILGQAVAFLLLRTYSRKARRLTVKIRGGSVPNIGELATVAMSAFDVTGEFLVMNHKRTDIEHEWLYELEFWESSFQQIALQSLLNIVGAARATVSISAALFPNSQVFSTPGSFTWTVPASVTTAQFTCYGSSASGGGGNAAPPTCTRFRGGNGGNSGKAVTILTVSAGQVYDVVVGAKGTPGGTTGASALCFWPEKGITSTDGVDGADTNIIRSAVTHCQGNAGLKGLKSNGSGPGADGAAGGGIGDAVSVGGGMDGGIGGIGGGTSAQPGLDGLAVIEW